MAEFVPQPLPWQRAQWLRLAQQIEVERLPHALLLAGPPSIGKRIFAQALASLLLCRSPRDGMACGTCKSCLLMAAQAHPDWHWLAPEDTGKAIKIDQVRNLVEHMVQTSQQGGRKVAVIVPAEAMNRSAANALLKTLEEPAGTGSLILVSDAPGRLMPTVRSRCQRLEFSVPALTEVQEWLRPLAASTEKLEQALVEADGRPLLARELLTGEGAALRRELDDELAAVLVRQVSVLAAAERWKQRDWPTLLYWLESRFVRALRTQFIHQPGTSAAVMQLASIPASALFVQLDQLRTLLNQTLAGTNPNPQLALESFLFSVCDAINRNRVG